MGYDPGVSSAVEMLRLIHPEPGPDALIELRAWGSRLHRSWHETVESAHAQALELADEMDVYYGVAPRTGRGGTAEYVDGLSCLWADLDCGEVSKAQRLEQLAGFGVSPQVLVDSGNGFHAYWLLDEVCEPEHGQRVMAGLAAALRGDAVGDPPRVLRVPGTTNHKGEPLPVHVVSVSAERVALADVEAAVEEADPLAAAAVGGRTVEIVYDAELGRATSFVVR